METRYKRLMFCGGYDVISLWLYQDYSLVFLHPSPSTVLPSNQKGYSAHLF